MNRRVGMGDQKHDADSEDQAGKRAGHDAGKPVGADMRAARRGILHDLDLRELRLLLDHLDAIHLRQVADHLLVPLHSTA